MFRIQILEQRLARHEETALKKFQDLDAKLAADPRMRALRGEAALPLLMHVASRTAATCAVVTVDPHRHAIAPGVATLATARASVGSSTRAFRAAAAGRPGRFTTTHPPTTPAQARDRSESKSSPVFSASAWTTSIKPGPPAQHGARRLGRHVSFEKPVPPHVSTSEQLDARSVMASWICACSSGTKRRFTVAQWPRTASSTAGPVASS